MIFRFCIKLRISLLSTLADFHQAYALCCKQTSPLDVPMYAFGFSLFTLYAFSDAPRRCEKTHESPASSFVLTGDSCIFAIHNYLFSFYIFLILRRGDIVSLAEYIAEAARVFKTDLRRNFADVLICSQKQLFGFFKALGI